MGTKVILITAFHPQINGQVERTIKILEYMIRSSVTDFPGNWDNHFSLVEFAYNNSYNLSISMALMKSCMVGDIDLQLDGLSGRVFNIGFRFYFYEF